MVGKSRRVAARLSGSPPLQMGGATNRQQLGAASHYGLTERSFDSVHEWLVAVDQAAKAKGYLIGLPTTFAQEMELYEDEDDKTPALMSLKAIERLKVQFLNHLAVCFGDGGAWDAPTIGLMLEDANTITVRLWRMNASGERVHLRDATGKFAEAFKSMHKASTTNCAAYKDLEEVVFRIYKDRTQKAVSRLRVLFKQHQQQFLDMLATMSGLYDDEHQARDTAMGDAVWALNMSTLFPDTTWPNGDDNDNDDKKLEDAISKCYALRYLEGGEAHTRLTNILGSSLANTIYNDVLVLVQPIKSFKTFARTAQVLQAFKAIEFKRGDPTTEPASPLRVLPTQPSVSQNPSIINYKKKLANIPPLIKNPALELMACVLDSCVPNPQTSAYYLFGFAACQSEDQVQRLGGLYARILTDTHSKDTILNLCQALAAHQLPQFFDKHGWNTFRSDLPYLENFLSTPLPERATVFRLVQFLQCTNDFNPPPVLIRDYGFHRCKMREEVELLKDIYRRTLATLSIFRLHQACLHNQLLDAVRTAGVSLEPKQQRFLENQHPLPDVGYQKITSRFLFDQGLFKYEKTKRLRMDFR